MLEWEEYKGFWLAEYALASFWIEKGCHHEPTYYYASVMIDNKLSLMRRVSGLYEAKMICEYWREGIVKNLESNLARTK